MKKKTVYFTLSCLLAVSTATAQVKTLTLDSCQVLARRNFPLIKQHILVQKTGGYTVANISRGLLPQINIAGQATYQSAVTEFPKALPGVPVLTKDQYRLYADVSQPLYDGGVIREQKKLQVATTEADQQNVDVQLYQVRDRINQLFFGVLLLQAQEKQNELVQKDLALGLDKTNAAIANGTALRSSADVLQASLLQTAEQLSELQARRQAFVNMLALFIDREIDTATLFVQPSEVARSQEIRRPELLLFDARNRVLDARDDLLSAKNRPKISFFVQAGFGKPALNILSNNFDPFYLGGLRVTFPLSGFYTLRNERSLIEVQRQDIAVERELFLFNSQVTLKQQDQEIAGLRKVLNDDEAIILLRERIKNTALAQLDNGTITGSDYIREVNAEDAAVQNRILHRTQLLVAEYNEQNTTGG